MSFSPYDNGVTKSFIDLFLTCKYQTYLYYVEKWTPIKPSAALHFGSLMHEMLSKCYEQRTGDRDFIVYQLRRLEQADTFPECEEREKHYGNAEILLQEYFRYYKNDLSEENEIFINEEEFSLRYKNIFLRGKIDLGFRNKEGSCIILDTKTASYINELDIIEGLPFDTQCMLYLWACNEINTFSYNVIRKPLERNKTENFTDYFDKVRDKIRKDPDHYFKRMPVFITKRELEAWEQFFLDPIVNEIETWCLNNFTPRPINPNALNNKYGRCAMYDMIVKKSTLGYYQRELVHQELSNEFDPSKRTSISGL